MQKAETSCTFAPESLQSSIINYIQTRQRKKLNAFVRKVMPVSHPKTVPIHCIRLPSDRHFLEHSQYSSKKAPILRTFSWNEIQLCGYTTQWCASFHNTKYLALLTSFQKW